MAKALGILPDELWRFLAESLAPCRAVAVTKLLDPEPVLIAAQYTLTEVYQGSVGVRTS